MRHLLRRAPLIGLAVTLATFMGCSGSGGSSSSSGGESTLVSITIQGSPTPIWPLASPNVPQNIPLNALITFTFGGPVNPASIPAPGQAIGSINIATTNGGSAAAALGTFQVQDDPSLPAGNRRRVIFIPLLPTDPQNPTNAGMLANTQYTISIPRGDSGAVNVVEVAGGPLQTNAQTIFQTRTCTVSDCFEDQIAGDPYVIQTSPATIDPDEGTPILVDPTTVTDDTISVFVNEPLNPANIDLTTVVLRNANTLAQVPGTVTFFQTGTFPLPAGLPATACRIDYRASSQLLADVLYEVTIDPAVTDFGQLSVKLFETPDTTPQRVFQTETATFCEQTAIAEDFNSIGNIDFTDGVMVWNGTGSATASFPLELVGDGSDMVVVYAAGNHDVETGSTAAGSTPCAGIPLSATYSADADGLLNATSITVDAGAVVRVYGTRPLHWRSLGPITINGTVDGSAFRNLIDATCYSGFFAKNGQFNNLGATVNGGRGGVGGGYGGGASQNGNPTRTDFGEDGFGPYINEAPNTNNPPNDTFGGGEGGPGDFFNTTNGQSGGQGGAGGSAWESGEDGLPRTGLGVVPLTSCGAPLATPSLTPAQATGAVAAWTNPMTRLVAGSGGGGGGDKFDNAPAGQNLDEQGGGAGGGAGGFRASCVQNLTIGNGASVIMDGSAGGTGPTFSGAGGSGSGGLILFQSFSQVDIQNNSTLRAEGGGSPAGNLSCTGAPGLGGRGFIQLEDSDGVINSNFITPTSTNVALLPFLFSENVIGIGQSVWFATNYGDPRYLEIQEVSDDGNAPAPVVGAGQPAIPPVLIEYQGAFESVTNPGTPDLNNLSPWVTSSAVNATAGVTDALDGYRFVRFRITLSYASPPASQPTDIFPSVSSITIRYEAPVGCP